MNFLDNVFFAFWFFLPAGLANMFPIFAAHTPGLRNWIFPMDFDLYFKGKRIFGPNKTIRGLVVGIIIAILFVFLEKNLFLHWQYVREVFSVDYANINVWVLGFLLGFGALLGDAVESFFKRQMNIDAGQSWLFFDQIDYILGAIILTLWYTRLNPMQYLYGVIIYLILHLVSTMVGFLLGLKQKAI